MSFSLKKKKKKSKNTLREASKFWHPVNYIIIWSIKILLLFHPYNIFTFYNAFCKVSLNSSSMLYLRYAICIWPQIVFIRGSNRKPKQFILRYVINLGKKTQTSKLIATVSNSSWNSYWLVVLGFLCTLGV